MHIFIDGIRIENYKCKCRSYWCTSCCVYWYLNNSNESKLVQWSSTVNCNKIYSEKNVSTIDLFKFLSSSILCRRPILAYNDPLHSPITTYTPTIIRTKHARLVPRSHTNLTVYNSLLLYHTREHPLPSLTHAHPPMFLLAHRHPLTPHSQNTPTRVPTLFLTQTPTHPTHIPNSFCSWTTGWRGGFHV